MGNPIAIAYPPSTLSDDAEAQLQAALATHETPEA